jgi:hypothetical protein
MRLMLEGVAAAAGGYYVAAYACPVEDGSFVGYFKVFAEEVDGYFADSICVLKGAWEIPQDSGGAAVDKALAYGRQQVLNLPGGVGARVRTEHRRPFLWELFNATV